MAWFNSFRQRKLDGRRWIISFKSTQKDLKYAQVYCLENFICTQKKHKKAESRRVKYRNRLQKCWSISVNYRAKQKSFSACFWPCGLRAAEQLCCVFKLSGTVYCHYCSPDNWIFCSTFWHYILSEEVALCAHVQHVNLDEVLYLRCYKYSISNVMLVNSNLYL